MSKSSTSVKVMGSSKSSTKYHVGTFLTDVSFHNLEEPISLHRKLQNPEPKKPTPAHRFGYEPPVQDPKTLPLILEDGVKTTTTGVYEEAPGSYMVLIRDGNVFRAYPVTSWFKFGAPKPTVDLDPNQPTPKPEGLNSKIHKKLGEMMTPDKEDEEAKRSRLRATKESRFAGGSEEGADEVGEEMDYDETFANDDVAQDDQPEEEEAVAPKKLSKAARKEASKLRGASSELDQNNWVYELLYGDSDDESDDEEPEEAKGEEVDEDDTSRGGITSTKKRQRDGAADEGRGDPKRQKSKIVQDEKYRKDRHSVITTLRSAFLNSSTLDSSMIVRVLRRAIPSFIVGGKPDLPPNEVALREYWSYILKGVLQEYTSNQGINKFSWKEHEKK